STERTTAKSPAETAATDAREPAERIYRGRGRFSNLSRASITPDDLPYSDGSGDCAVDGPLMVVHHETHRATRHHRCVEGNIERLQDPHGAQEDGGQAEKSTDDAPEGVERSRHISCTFLRYGHCTIAPTSRFPRERPQFFGMVPDGGRGSQTNRF